MTNQKSLLIAYALVGFTTLAATSIAFANESEALKNRMIFEAEAKVAKLKNQGTWVEVPTNRMTTRRFVAVADEGDTDQPKLVHLRTDFYTRSSKEVSTRIRTIELDCDKGMERLLVTRELDLSGAETMKVSPSKSNFLPVESPFTSPQRYVCTGEYLLGFIPNGHQQLQDFILRRRAEVSALVPYRAVPVPIK
jgi:hypothetical protein